MYKMMLSLATSPDKANFAPLIFAGHLNRGMQRAAELGFDGLELNIRDSHAIDKDLIIEGCRSLGLTVPSFGTGQSYFADGLSLANPDGSVQQLLLERMRGHIQFAAEMNASVVLGSIRGKLDSSSAKGRKVCYETALETTRSLAEYAESLKVKLTVEPINRYETNFINTIEEAMEFIDGIGSINVGVLIDTFHMNIEEPSMTKGILKAGERIWHVHLADSNRCAPGMGHLNFNEIVEALGAVGYSGFLSAEILPVPDDLTAARRWIEMTRQLISSK
jgi:sugar phosphate isomerase/epimerase